MSNNKELLLKISGILLLIHAVSNIIFKGLNIFYIVSDLILTLYCLWLNNKKLGNIFYYISLGIYIIRDLLLIIYYHEIFTLWHNKIHTLWLWLYEIFFMIYLIFIKIKCNKIIAFTGMAFIGIYFIMELLGGGMVGVFFPIPLAVMWWGESKGYFIKNKTVINNLENDLAVLKNLFEEGRISEHEYNKRKTKILNKI